MKAALIECVRLAGKILLEHFGRVPEVARKGHHSDIVTAADLASEKMMREYIRARFPAHTLIGEESGLLRQDSEITWVIDPLDGTSNFAAGLPWFGVLLAVLERNAPVMAAMFVPISDTLYFAEKGGGVSCNGVPVRVSAETDLSNILCAFGLDAAASTAEARYQTELLQRVVGRVRNFRCTNCLLDFCYVVDGRLGACINLNTKIWDIAPLSLMLPEAGGRLTDMEGREIAFRLAEEPFARNYTVLGANPVLHAQLLKVVRKRETWNLKCDS